MLHDVISYRTVEVKFNKYIVKYGHLDIVGAAAFSKMFSVKELKGKVRKF